MVITSFYKKSRKFSSKGSKDERSLISVSPKALTVQLNRIKTAIIGIGLLFFQTGRPLCDVIYFTNGTVLVVDKAWEEGEEVRYQSSAGTKTLVKSSVRR